jgi:ubiquinone/menaquinone biosynthesis C-methylase UbiE
MMRDPIGAVAEAFSRKATIYDAFGKAHPNLMRMREKVYARIESLVPVGSYLLELNAGTGLDAAAMVGRGYRVHATDIAPGMLAQIQHKIARCNLGDWLTAQQCSFTELDQISAGPFDAVYSNFGGLNCVDDLTLVTRHLTSLLKPGGVVVWVIMPPVCLWELARLPQDFRVATRRLKHHNVRSNVEGVEFLTTYFTPREVRHAFGPAFGCLSVEGLSVLTPPADNKTFRARFPHLFRVLAVLDDRIAKWPVLRQCGDFFVITMQYAP